MKRVFIGALCALTLLCSCESKTDNKIVGTWKYQTPTWHEMTTYHTMQFDYNGHYELMVEYIDRGKVDGCVVHGEYKLEGDRLCIFNRRYASMDVLMSDTIVYRAVINGNSMLLQEGDYEPVIYRR